MYLGDQKLPVDVPLSRYSLTGLNRFNPKVCGLQSPCLRLTRAVTDTGSRLGMECAGSALSQWHFQPPVVRHFVAHDRAEKIRVGTMSRFVLFPLRFCSSTSS